jgi:hypothetical protein
MNKRRRRPARNLPRLITLVVVVVAIIMNPSKDDFYEWASNQSLQESNTVVEGAIKNLLMSPLLKTVTVRNNFVLFSTFKIEVGENETVYVGAFNKFFKLKD